MSLLIQQPLRSIQTFCCTLRKMILRRIWLAHFSLPTKNSSNKAEKLFKQSNENDSTSHQFLELLAEITKKCVCKAFPDFKHQKKSKLMSESNERLSQKGPKRK